MKAREKPNFRYMSNAVVVGRTPSEIHKMMIETLISYFH